MMIRALIVDDEPLARRAVCRLLKGEPGVEIVCECGDGESALNAILNERPDLVFLDVQMPEMDGFEVIRHVGVAKMPATIFVTAYDRYALRAFDAHAADYLLKPIGRARFAQALERARERITQMPHRETAERFAALLDRVAAPREFVERLPVAESGRILLVKTREIDWLEADGNYTRLHLGIHSFLIRETLTTLEKKLNPQHFLRIHRSTIVNVQRVKEVRPWLDGYHAVLLDNGKELRMSRYQKDAAKRLGLKG